MHDYTVSEPHCVSNPDFFKDDCGSPAWAYGLFTSWNILSMYIFASMVLNVVWFRLIVASHRCIREFFLRVPTSWKTASVHPRRNPSLQISLGKIRSLRNRPHPKRPTRQVLLRTPPTPPPPPPKPNSRKPPAVCRAGVKRIK